MRFKVHNSDLSRINVVFLRLFLCRDKTHAFYDGWSVNGRVCKEGICVIIRCTQEFGRETNVRGIK